MYIWQDYDKTRRFSANSIPSIHEAEKSNTGEVSVNIGDRFSVLGLGALKRSDPDGDIENIIFHYLAELDIAVGDAEFGMKFDIIAREILDGRYGERVKKCFQATSERNRRLIISYLYDYIKSGERLDLFERVFLDLFGKRQNIRNSEFDSDYTDLNAEIYYHKATEIFYCYCAVENTRENTAAFETARLLFADCRHKIIPVWGRCCFGVTDNEKKSSTAAYIGKIQIINGGYSNENNHC